MSLLLGLVPWWGRILAVAGILVAAAAWGAAKMHSHDARRYDALEASYEAFKDGVRNLGIQARKDNEARAKADKERKEQADAENARTRAADQRTIAGLRAAAAKRDSRGGSAAAAPAGSKCPDGLTCFDRAEYQRALGEFDSEARRGADEGTAVTADLNTAKRWAQRLKLSRVLGAL